MSSSSRRSPVFDIRHLGHKGVQVALDNYFHEARRAHESRGRGVLYVRWVPFNGTDFIDELMFVPLDDSYIQEDSNLRAMVESYRPECEAVLCFEEPGKTGVHIELLTRNWRH